MRLKQLLGPLPSSGLSSAMIVLFLAFFIGLCFYVWRRDRQAIYEHLENLPLEEKSHD